MPRNNFIDLVSRCVISVYLCSLFLFVKFAIFFNLSLLEFLIIIIIFCNSRFVTGNLVFYSILCGQYI